MLINPATAWGRSIIAGVGDYSRTRGGWVLRFESGNGRQDQYLPKGWHGDGVIARIVSTEQLEALLSVGVPVINIAESKLARGVTTFQVDTGRIAQVAAEHFVGRGIRHFRFLGLKNFTPSRERYRLFHAAVAKSAESTGCFEIPQEFRTQSQARNSREELITWLIKLPRPVGLFCWCDEQARLGIEACQLAVYAFPRTLRSLESTTTNWCAT
ncbi:MAG: substrate-binding domain-containing protein [Phycisphaerales bacterium]|nr:substrate-binding domain-containing protein [Phycisphaerales bacterium]